MNHVSRPAGQIAPADQTAPAGLDLSAAAPAEDDLDLLAEGGRRVTRVTVFLIAAVLVGLAFIGGVVVQKQFGSTSAGGFPGGASAMGGGGGMPGYGGGQSGGMPGGYGGGRSGGASGPGTSAGGDSADSAASAAPAVVGTVTKVSGRTLTVKNFADESVTVKVPKGTTISDSSDSALKGLAKGVSVSVVGEKADDGTITATSITAG
ncbi:DUF5666 domain-containing protein [Kineosporia babensis]|uniref:DUF5666 domain-containing protein n=1 Tax=Kineosporia babensis TaxID=499548 RepID=A0A9X1N8I1_9ACTN|nr:DUF5666 domain-containing protein [Kineosporia babensis]